MKTTLEQQIEAVKGAASWTKQPTDGERQALADAYFTLKKLADRKKPRVKKEVDVLYAEFVELWCKAYPTLGFNAVAGQKIKAMIVTSRQIVEERSKLHGVLIHQAQPFDDRVKGIFNYILDYVKRTNHWCHGKSITTFESKYREIYTEIINGKSTTKKQSTWERVNAL